MRFLTAGESHGEKLTAIIEGMPSGVQISKDQINMELARRQKGYGRGGRMTIETDKIKVTSGIRNGKTIGAPIALEVNNKDWSNWQHVMSVFPEDTTCENMKKRLVKHPRPGHADLIGGIKYGHRDLRNVLERSSARETTMRVAIGAIVRQMLEPLGINIYSFVKEIGGITSKNVDQSSLLEQFNCAENSPVRCIDEIASKKMMDAIDLARESGDTLGGSFEIIVTGLPMGLGSYVHCDRKIDALIGKAILSIQAIKGFEIGGGFLLGRLAGSSVQDEIIWDKTHGNSRKTNRLGGIEGGMTSGQPLVVRAVMKPIATLYKPLQSFDIDTKKTVAASVERSDTCAVPAAAVIAENVVAWEIACAIVKEYFADTFDDLKMSLEYAKKKAREF